MSREVVAELPSHTGRTSEDHGHTTARVKEKVLVGGL